jgi:hypothetical protein
VEWESQELEGYGRDCLKADPSLKSFLFTLKNPHNVPARRFALKAEKKDEAPFCNFDSGPNFFDIRVRDNSSSTRDSIVDFGVSDNCNSWTNLGTSYTNDTGLDGKTFFTGSRNFQVKEIEVFEISK